MTELQSITFLVTRRVTFISHFLPQVQFKVSVLIVFVILFPQSRSWMQRIDWNFSIHCIFTHLKKNNTHLNRRKLELLRNRIARRLASKSSRPVSTHGQARLGSVRFGSVRRAAWRLPFHNVGLFSKPNRFGSAGLGSQCERGLCAASSVCALAGVRNIYTVVWLG
jgi:hypothetical protein